jgi:selenocysteine-specific elongation factor
MQVRVLNTLNKEGFTSSSLDQLATKTDYQKEKLMRILNVAEQEGKLLRIDGKLMFTQQNFLDLKNKVIRHFTTSEILSVAEFKELAKTSRKYAVPLLEYFDKQKITYRDGNSRKLVK